MALTLPIDEEPPPPAPTPPQALLAPRRKARRPWVYAAGALLLLGAGAGLGRWIGPRSAPAMDRAALLETERASLWAAVEEARRVRDWGRCAEHAERMLALPDSAAYPQQRTREVLETARAEQRNLLMYDRFLQAVARRAPDAAVLAYQELSPDSVYRSLGAARYQEVRESFVRLHLERARVELEQSGCRAALPHLDAVAAVEPEAAGDERLLALRSRCRPGAPAGGLQAGPGVAGPRAPAGPLAARPPAAQLEEAQQAYISGDYRLAIRIAQQHTARDPARAWRVIGGAACYLGDEALIRQTLDHLDDPAQQFVRQVCQRNGISP